LQKYLFGRFEVGRQKHSYLYSITSYFIPVHPKGSVPKKVLNLTFILCMLSSGKVCCPPVGSVCYPLSLYVILWLGMLSSGSELVMPTLRYFTIETLRFYAFVNKKNLTNVYFSL
jgi:hypothetical protein